MRFERQGLTSGLFVLGAAIVVFIATWNMPAGPAGFPRLIAGVMGLCGLLLIARSHNPNTANTTATGGMVWHLPAIVGGLWLVLIAAIGWLGFLVPGVIFLAVVAWILLGRPGGARNYALIIAYAIGFAAALWGIFGRALGVESPGGFLF